MIPLQEQRIDTFEDARAYTRQYAKTFYFASHVLPREKRAAAYAIYGFCRLVDNVTDAGVYTDRQHAAAKLQALREDIRSICNEAPGHGKGWSALREVVTRYQIPENHFLDLIRGVEMDLTRSRYATFEELQEYCYCVASVVGMIMSRVLGASDPEALQYAADLGTGMQLTNILRDVGEDLQMGRIYLPAADLQQYGIGEDDLKEQRVNDAFRELMRFQITRARSYYARAAEGILLLPDDGSRYCVRIMSSLYERILDQIVANGYDVFRRRAYVPLSEKLTSAILLALHGGARTAVIPA
jgi:15-cis-phytoene synthase